MIDENNNKINNRTTKKQIMDMELRISYCLNDCSKKLKDDKDVVLKFVRTWGGNLKFASDRLRDDEDVIKAGIKCLSSTFKYASDRIQRDPKMVKLAVKYQASSFLYACDELKKNKKFILELVKLYGFKPIEYCYYTTRDDIYEKLETPAIQALEEMIKEENK